MADPRTNSDSETPPEQPEPARISGTLNYLRWFAAEEPPGNLGFPFNADTTLEWLCQELPDRPLLEVLRTRYRDLAGLDGLLFFFPIEYSALVEKVLVPLHEAKVAYVLGHELGCIALSGMVAEMLAILRFQISPFGSGPKALTRSRQERLFGGSFEQIAHSRRVGNLELLRLIDLETGSLFNELRAMRNKYLHRLSHPHDQMAKDAIRAYEIAVKLAAQIFGLGIKDARVTINRDLLAYMRAHGSADEAAAAEDGKDWKEWLEKDIPHRVRAAVALSNRLMIELGLSSMETPRINAVQRHCEHDAVWEGRLVTLRWLIEFVGIKEGKNGRAARPKKRKGDVRINDLPNGVLFDLHAKDNAQKLATAWRACSQGSSHATLRYAGKPTINDPEREEALDIIINHLSTTIYRHHSDWLTTLVLIRE